MSALTIAKTLITYDSNTDLETTINNQNTPALQLLNSYLNDYDYQLYNNTLSNIHLVKFEEASDELYTKCFCETKDEISNFYDGMELQINTTDEGGSYITTYNGYYKISNIDISDYSFWIKKVFSITGEATAINVRKSKLEYAHAYFILYMLVTSAQQIVINKVIFNSEVFGEGTTAQASIESKVVLAQIFMQKAMTYLNYCYSEAI